jgi:hypothetical protein
MSSSPSSQETDKVNQMIRLSKIINNSVETGRNPLDTAGLDTSDEEWLSENQQFSDYIFDEWKSKMSSKKENKTLKKSPAHTYPYPEEFLKKDGKLKASNKKKRLLWLKQYKLDQLKPSVEKEPEQSRLDQGQLDFLSGISDQELQISDIEGITLNKPNFERDLPIGLNEHFNDQLLDEYVFDNKGRMLTHETCIKLRNYCELFPRKCYLEKEFLEKYIRICKLIAKTSLYIDAFYKRVDDSNMTSLIKYAESGPSGAQVWRSKLRSTNTTAYTIIMDRIPSSQMPNDSKEILINVLGNMRELSGGVVKKRIGLWGDEVPQFRENWRMFIVMLKKRPDLFEEFVQKWREGMATQTTRKPKQIEEIIRRFIKNL